VKNKELFLPIAIESMQIFDRLSIDGYVLAERLDTDSTAGIQRYNFTLTDTVGRVRAIISGLSIKRINSTITNKILRVSCLIIRLIFIKPY